MSLLLTVRKQDDLHSYDW